MSDFDDLEAQVTAWLEPLSGDAGQCGPDLEYDNEFLELTKAVAGKPESQFGPAEPPDWRGAVEIAASLFERTRDLRVAVDWARGQMRLRGYGALPAGLKLINGLIEWYWELVHPLPDPDDGDPYGRVNALTLLREPAGLLGDLREARLSDDRSIGVLLPRDIEAALAGSGAAAPPSELTREQALRMLAATVERYPALRATCAEALSELKKLMSQLNDKLGQGVAPDLRPTYLIVNGIAGALPPEAEAGSEDDTGDDGAGEGGEGGGARSTRGLSGAVTSREEALRAIDLVIDFLERSEPTNPAPLFLRRARQLVGHNFLQLMKVLAPDALGEVARMVGVDPDSVEDPMAPNDPES